MAFSKRAPIKSEGLAGMGSAGDVGTRIWIFHLCPNENQEHCLWTRQEKIDLLFAKSKCSRHPYYNNLLHS